jgi:hypothetical protein
VDTPTWPRNEAERAIERERLALVLLEAVERYQVSLPWSIRTAARAYREAKERPR